MSIESAYNSWANQYDTNRNRTRDAEHLALKKTLGNLTFDHCLEVGCGTGKNTTWLMERVNWLTGVDLSENMLNLAMQKVNSAKVNFKRADIRQPWVWCDTTYDLITFSLVLEHIKNLDAVFKEVSCVLKDGGFVYIGELHPFKQYAGTKARFETETGTQIVECYNHHVSDFASAGKRHGLSIITVDEHFDDDDRETIPRIVAILFQKRQR